MNLNQLKKFFHSLLSINPARDWFIILILAVAFLFCEVAYAGYLYYGIHTGGIVGTTDVTVETPVSVSATEIEKTLEIYRARKLDFETRNFKLPSLSDPAK